MIYDFEKACPNSPYYEEDYDDWYEEGIDYDDLRHAEKEKSLSEY